MMKVSIWNPWRKEQTAIVSLAFLFMLSFSFVSCDKRNIHQVVKEMAEAPVDTVGFVGRSLQTNPFSTVDIDCFADVTYHQTPVGSDHYVVLKAPAKVLDNLKVIVEDGDLAVSVDRRYRMPEKAVAVLDIYAPFVSSFTLDGGKCLRLGKMTLTSPLELNLHGNVGAFTADTLAVHELTLALDGSGSYDLRNISTGDLRAKMTGKGTVNVTGKCHSAVFVLKGDGFVNASELVSETAIEHKIEGKGKVMLVADKKK